MLAGRLYSISLAKCFYQEYFLHCDNLASRFLSVRRWRIPEYHSGCSSCSEKHLVSLQRSTTVFSTCEIACFKASHWSNSHIIIVLCIATFSCRHLCWFGDGTLQDLSLENRTVRKPSCVTSTTWYTCGPLWDPNTHYRLSSWVVLFMCTSKPLTGQLHYLKYFLHRINILKYVLSAVRSYKATIVFQVELSCSFALCTLSLANCTIRKTCRITSTSWYTFCPLWEPTNPPLSFDSSCLHSHYTRFYMDVV